MAVKTEYRHIVLDQNGQPVIEGTSMKVIELVVERIAYGWSSEELHFQHPHLTLGQIHSALAYYWDHSEELKQQIDKCLKKVEKIKKEQEQPPLIKKLKSQGLI